MAKLAERRASLTADPSGRYSEGAARVKLGDAIEILARWALGNQIRRVPIFMQHVAEGRCMLGDD